MTARRWRHIVLRSVVVIAAWFTFTANQGARADDDDASTEAPSYIHLHFAERGVNLVASGSITQLFDSTAYEALDSGFPSTVVIRTWVYREDGTTPISDQLWQRRVYYDLWDEIYVVQVDGPNGSRTEKVRYRAEALRLLTNLEEVPVVPLASIPYTTHYVLALVVELNPVSQATLTEVRRWLSQGSGGGLDRGGSFFGSFVSVFVNPKVADADRVLRLRSQPFFRTPP